MNLKQRTLFVLLFQIQNAHVQTQHGIKTNVIVDVCRQATPIAAQDSQSPQISSLDLPSSMDTCSPTTGVAGLCIRGDIAPMVCTPLGYEIGGQMSCATDRLCCYSTTGGVPVAPLSVTVSPPLFPNQPGGSAATCQVGPGITGVCVPSNLVSSMAGVRATFSEKCAFAK